MQAQLFLLEKKMVACIYVEIIENLIKKNVPDKMPMMMIMNWIFLHG